MTKPLAASVGAGQPVGSHVVDAAAVAARDRCALVEPLTDRVGRFVPRTTTPADDLSRKYFAPSERQLQETTA
jgi:hypothetical protein